MSKIDEIWNDRLKDWERSGLSRAAWCRANEQSYYAFHYWYQKLRIRNLPAGDKNPDSEIEFVELKCMNGKVSPDPGQTVPGIQHTDHEALTVRYKDYVVGIAEGTSKQCLTMVMEVLANA